MVEGKLSVSTQRGFSKVYSHCDLHQKNQKSQKLSIFEIRDEFGRTQNRKTTVPRWTGGVGRYPERN